MTYLEAGKKLIANLNKEGYLAYLVGGSVRDSLLNKPIDDVDITTNALPEYLSQKYSFKNTGGAFLSGEVTFLDFKFQVTTFRKELYTKGSRKPRVSFVANLEDDLMRRDFTINAIAMDANGKIIDPIGGLVDLNLGSIKAIGDPDILFENDPLRLLRACYFASKLAFTIESRTFKAMQNKASEVKILSNERVLGEIQKIIRHNGQLIGFDNLKKSGIAVYIPYLRKAIDHVLTTKHFIRNITELLLLAYIFEDKILEGLNIPKVMKETIVKAAALRNVVEDNNFNPLILYVNGKNVCIYANRINVLLDVSLDATAVISERYAALPIKKTCDLAFKGQDILELNIASSATEIQEIVDIVKYAVLMKQVPNDYQAIAKFVIQQKNKSSEDAGELK